MLQLGQNAFRWDGICMGWDAFGIGMERHIGGFSFIYTCMRVMHAIPCDL